MTTTTTTEVKLLTAADLLRLDGEGVRGELIRGVALRNHARVTVTREDRHEA